jgi:hypothetical protein
LASARSTIRSSRGGRPGRRCEGGSTGEVSVAAINALSVSRSCGNDPVIMR